MPKALCIFALAISALFLLLFSLDLAIGIPFNGSNKLAMDIPIALCSLALGYISWTTLREQV
ncbi:MAG TPA: hypothetical protein VIH42_07135 [Thermoguttaceae bacterium]